MGGHGSSSSSSTGNATEQLSLLKAYSLLQTKYGWTVEYIRGKWKKICLHSQEPCIWGSCLERKTCKDYTLELYGLTRPLFLQFVKLSSDDNFEREKRLYNVLGLLITGKPVVKDDNNSNYNKGSEKDIEAKKKDILYDFPYDIQYPGETQILENIRHWSTVEDKDNIEYWDEERGQAARGKMGIIARRCSANGLLWSEYKEGKYKDQATLKCRIKLDHIRLALYPATHPRHLICVESPPLEWIKFLHEQGDLAKHVKDLSACGWELDGVVPISDEVAAFIKEIKTIDVKPESKG